MFGCYVSDLRALFVVFVTLVICALSLFCVCCVSDLRALFVLCLAVMLVICALSLLCLLR